MIKSNLIDYVLYTPHNFNSSVFNSLLDNYLNNIRQFYEKSNLTKLEDYLYLIEYDDIDYAAGAEYNKKFMAKLGACSSVYKDGLYGRNYDWYYDNAASFIVKTSANQNRHASIGVAAVAKLTKDLVEGLSWNDFYATLPNMMLDGINDAGVVCNINVTANGDYGFTNGTNPKKEDLCILSLVRYILDNADSVDHAIELLYDRNLWAPHGEILDSELHFMIGDSTKCCVVEFINNEIKVIDDAKIMTNFYLYGVEFNEDGSVYTPATQTDTKNAIITNHITPFGSGLERYNKALSELPSVESIADMTTLMQNLYYSQAYTDNPDENSWYTELVGVNGLTVVSTPEQYTPTFKKAYQLFEHRDRNEKTTWQTVHTSIYDIGNLAIDVYCQEGTTKHSFSLNA